MHPPPPQPEPNFIAVLDLLGYKDHLWDNAGERRPNGITALYETLFLWLTAADHGTSFSGLNLTPEGQVVVVNESIDFIVASDTIMLWAPEPKAQFLIATVGRVFVRALGWGAPLRGAIAFGDCILDLQRQILIGYPIVEAVEAEKRQEWLGIAVLPEAASKLHGVVGVVPYDVPVKAPSSGSSLQPLRHALAWHWAEEVPNAAEIYLKRLRGLAPASHQTKYENTLSFIRSVPRE